MFYNLYIWLIGISPHRKILESLIVMLLFSWTLTYIPCYDGINRTRVSKIKFERFNLTSNFQQQQFNFRQFLKAQIRLSDPLKRLNYDI